MMAVPSSVMTAVEPSLENTRRRPTPGRVTVRKVRASRIDDLQRGADDDPYLGAVRREGRTEAAGTAGDDALLITTYMLRTQSCWVKGKYIVGKARPPSSFSSIAPTTPTIVASVS